MKKSDIFWQTYLNLEKEAIEVSKYIFFTDEILVNGPNGIVTQTCTSQLDVFSPYIADLFGTVLRSNRSHFEGTLF